MAVISGENGAVYFNAEITATATGGNITFYSTSTGLTSNTIVSSSGTTGYINFEEREYSAGMLITISGASSGTTGTLNNRTFTIGTVSSGQLEVSEKVTSGTDTTGTLVFEEAEPGIQVLGFYNWALSYTGDVLETTNFDNSSGGRNYIPSLTSWTATADKHFLTVNNEVDDWVGGTCEIRLFTKYVAVSTASNFSQYWSGDTVVTGIDETTPVDAMITQSISFQGDNALVLKTQTDPWSCGISS